MPCSALLRARESPNAGSDPGFGQWLPSSSHTALCTLGILHFAGTLCFAPLHIDNFARPELRIAMPSKPSCARAALCAISLAALTALASCGGSQSSPPPTYTIGGTVINLAGAAGGLTLTNNGGDSLPVSANGTFTFSTPITGGDAYSVTISQQPTNPAQTCGVTGGSGNAASNVTSIQVNCAHNEWTWVSGSSMIDGAGVYGTMGVPAASNNPGARQPCGTWTDSSGAVWMFGGYGYDSKSALEPLNDMWKFSAGQWTWMGGSNLVGQSGVYGTLGEAASTNVPGARNGCVSWKDSSGAFWIFGGDGFDSQGTEADMNDVWKYSNGEWTWMGGSKIATQPGVYGTQGVAAPDNIPSARSLAVGAADSSGNFWLFGGNGYDSTGKAGELNDFWQYSNGEWTWVSGSMLTNQGSVTGTMGVPAAGNTPGSKLSALGWVDSSGNFWVYGGTGWGAPGVNTIFGDLWEFSNGEWTWISGSQQTGFAPAVYGVKGVAAAANTPGWRQASITWSDASGNIWLFGGNSSGASGTGGMCSDLWKYSNGQWTWMAGPNLAAQIGVYGTQGLPAPANVPGGRSTGLASIDPSGNVWLFGGFGNGPSGALGDFNDLWMYMP
jgi:hypothetical protein